MKKECNNCYFYNSTYCTELSKAKFYPECSFNSGYNEAQERIILSYYKEYNTDTSAGHPTSEGDDIVRYSEETQRVKDKEP